MSGPVERPDDIVGHKTMADGSHLPLRRDEADAILAESDRLKAKRAADMPTEREAIHSLFEAYQRLRELGWREAIYCPKDGTPFDAIEVGSTGVHQCVYEGEWPHGGWWSWDGEMWPMSPCLFRPPAKWEAAQKTRMAEAAARFRQGKPDA